MFEICFTDLLKTLALFLDSEKGERAIEEAIESKKGEIVRRLLDSTTKLLERVQTRVRELKVADGAEMASLVGSLKQLQGMLEGLMGSLREEAVEERKIDVRILGRVIEVSDEEKEREAKLRDLAEAKRRVEERRLGEIRVIKVGFDLGGLVLSWGLMLLVAITEEICVRGFVLGRLLNSGMNKYLALFLSAFLFSILHLFNPNFSMLPFINILLAGLLLGFMYIYTRNLWFPISLHLFWNWLQGPVLGFEVSGADFDKTLLTLNLPTKSILNGGDFGFEDSIS